MLHCCVSECGVLVFQMKTVKVTEPSVVLLTWFVCRSFVEMII